MSVKKTTFKDLIAEKNSLIKKLDEDAKAIAKTLHDNRDQRRQALIDRAELYAQAKTEKTETLVKKAEDLAAKKAAKALKAQEAALAAQKRVEDKKAKVNDLVSTSGGTIARKAASKKVNKTIVPDLDPIALENELKELN
jgi:hypothetical protein